jgi:hypothetical protein
MKAKDFLKLITEGKNIIGLYLVSSQYICAGFVPGSGGTMKVWGYYPYLVKGIKFTSSGKLQIKVVIINRLGTKYAWPDQPGIKDFLNSTEEINYNFNKDLEFYNTEEEAINECHLRNRGKKGPGPCCNMDMTQVSSKDSEYISQKYY